MLMLRTNDREDRERSAVARRHVGTWPEFALIEMMQKAAEPAQKA